MFVVKARGEPVVVVYVLARVVIMMIGWKTVVMGSTKLVVPV